MKKILALFLVIAVIFCFYGCGSHHENTDGYTFTDDLGRSVSVNSTERVAAMLGSFADMWLLAGGKLCASADDAVSDYNLSLGDEVINLGSTHSPDKERLISCTPDLVFASAKLSKQLAMRETLEAMGITVAFFDVSNFRDYLRVFKIMTDLTGKSENYHKYGTLQEEKIDALFEKYKNEATQKVLVLRVSAASIRAKNSEDTLLGGMLKDFGIVNIADSDSMLLDKLNIESIVSKNPDKIFLVEMGDNTDIKKDIETMFRENPLWYKLDAVKNGEVYFMEKTLFNMKPNARFAEAYEKLGAILYEE